MVDLKLESQLLDSACKGLIAEMGQFAYTSSMATLQSLDPDLLHSIQDEADVDYDYGSWEHWRDYAPDLQKLQKVIQSRDEVDPKQRGRALEEERLLSTVRWMLQEFETQLKEAETGAADPIAALAHKADILREFSEMWTVYQVAWEQRHQPATWEPDLTLRSLQAGDKVVRSLYEVVEDQDLDLKIFHQWLIVVPFMSGLYSTAFDAPTPYVIGPYWGHQQVWTWLGYAHEVGHHVYRNVNGLADELKVNVAVELWKEGVSYELQRIWFNWLEEVFADLFGLLRVGAAFARTQQIMLLHLPFGVFRRGEEGGDFRSVFLRAADVTHPIPHLRVFLGIQALERLGTPQQDIDALKDEWKKVFNGEVDTAELYVRDQGVVRKLSADEVKEMYRIGGIILDVLLDTELHALAEKTSPPEEKKSRTLKTVMLEPPAERERMIESARKTLESDMLAGKFRMQHLLAAVQKRLGEVRIFPDFIEELSERVIKTITGVFEEPKLPMLS